MKIRVGDKVRHELFGGEIKEGIITDIEICKLGTKEGRTVMQCDTDKHPTIVCNIDNGHWCYGSQIIEIIDN